MPQGCRFRYIELTSGGHFEQSEKSCLYDEFWSSEDRSLAVEMTAGAGRADSEERPKWQGSQVCIGQKNRLIPNLAPTLEMWSPLLL
jgi:hypothetical protein